MKNLKDKRIIVAGGATGIGAASAERLAEEGASVVVGDINHERAEQTAQSIRDNGGQAVGMWFDLSDEASIEQLVKDSFAHLGGIDGLYNVGADLRPENLGRDGDILGMEAALWARTLQVNLIGYALTARAVIPHLLENEAGGTIVNTSSDAAFIGETVRPAYAVSKAGVNALTRHIASTWGKQGIRCNGVSPGMVVGELQIAQQDHELIAAVSALTRSPRLGKPADLAAAVAFLFSDDAEWINGQTWSIGGGINMRD